LESWFLKSGTTFSLLQYFVLVAAWIESPVLHKHVLEKGISWSTACLDKAFSSEAKKSFRFLISCFESDVS
jgi:hypothetical protein